MITPSESSKWRLLWIPVLASTIIASAVVLSWYLLIRQREAIVERTIRSGTQIVVSTILRDLDVRANSLRRLADRWDSSGGASRFAWDADVTNIFDDQPGYQAFAWADASLHIRWSTPPSSNGITRDLALNTGLIKAQSAKNARDTRKLVFSSPIELVHGNTGFVAYHPVFHDDQFDGLMIAVFNNRIWINALANNFNIELFGSRVSLGGNVIYDSSLPDDLQKNAVRLRWLEAHAFTKFGLDWKVEVWPIGSGLAYLSPYLTNMLLIGGLLISALTGWIIHGYFASRHHARQMGALLANLPGMTYRREFRASAPMVFVNSACLSLSGYSKTEFEQHQIRWADLVDPAVYADQWKKIEHAVNTKQPYVLEYRLCTRSGEEKWVWERGCATFNHGGRIEMLDGLIIDVTDRKDAELAFIDAMAYSNAVVDTVSEAVVTIDSDGQIETFNRSAQSIFGYEQREVIGKSVNCLMPEPYHGEHHAYMERYKETGERRILETGRDVNAKHKDGTVFPIHLSVREITVHGEQRFVGLMRDLSDQHAAEREASMNREQLAHVDRLNTLGEMATGIAHEINQPLSAISMYAQFGLRYMDTNVQKPKILRDALLKMSLQAHRAGAVIKRMQDLTRKRESVREKLECNDLMRRIGDLAKSEAMVRDMRIAIEYCEISQFVYVDPIQIQQVVLNLLLNGMEAMESIEKRYGKKIVLRATCDGEGVTMSVIDRGTGISDVVAETLFEPFSTTKKSGMGVGLSICRSIVNAHGGHLEFSNNEQCGATFHFTLPLASEG